MERLSFNQEFGEIEVHFSMRYQWLNKEAFSLFFMRKGLIT